MNIQIIPPRRTPDAFGKGHYGAPRGKRKHNGEDLNCCHGSIILSNQTGRVTKIGYPYADDLTYRYIQITSSDGIRDFRFFYVEPSVKLGDWIEDGDVIGSAQNLELRYEGISNHIHFEVKVDGKHVDPNPFLED